MGSKNRIAKEILKVISEYRGNRTWVEPFVGGANMIDKVDGVRIGSDNQKYVIALLKALQDGWVPPENVSKDFFTEVKSNKENYSDALVGYLGTQLTFGCEWFGSFRRDNAGVRQYDVEAYTNVVKQSSNLKDITFIHCDYRDLEIPTNSLIYCDPPYKGVRKYVGNVSFNNGEFWSTCRKWGGEGHIVFVSEYDAPDDFECVWSKTISASANNAIKSGQGLKVVEKLFRLRVL